MCIEWHGKLSDLVNFILQTKICLGILQVLFLRYNKILRSFIKESKIVLINFTTSVNN